MSLIPGSRRGALARFAIGSAIVILFTATSTAVALLLQVKQIAQEIARTPALKSAAVDVAHPGNAQTLLLIGSDHRAGTPFSAANTDTMMLVRLDPKSATINVLSIPRDLRVQIPERGGLVTSKINATYSIGGPNLLVRVLRQEVFPGLRINHIIDVNFGGFEALVDAIGCVYTDVDHRYYHQSAPDAADNYSSIDIQPGYQKLCGSDALAFVRFRHTDSDIVRNARQQDFLRWAKDQYPASKIIANRDRLLRIFGEHTQTDHDLHTVDGLLNLFELVAFSAGHTIKQIAFPAILLPCGGGTTVHTATGALIQQGAAPCYVTADPGAEQAAFHALMTPTRAAAKSSGTGSGGGGSGAGGGGRGHKGGGAPTAGLMPDLVDGKAQASALGRVGVPVYVPRLIANGSRYCASGTCSQGPVDNSYPRSYLIRDQHGKPYYAYRLTLALNPQLGQYYGIEGTTWQNPPILDSPTQTRMVAGKQLMEFFNGGKLSVVAWRTRGGVYWISNTLTDDLSTQQMVGIAASLTRAGP